MLLIQAEAFLQPGGWVLDTQSMPTLGSPYLMAHGLGAPVADAVTTVRVPEAGDWRVWVRTVNWTEKFGAPSAPGRFQVLVGDRPLAHEFGSRGAAWHWQDGGIVALPVGEVELRLRDLTGFNGRCDAILLCRDKAFRPPDDPAGWQSLRRKLSGTETPEDGGRYPFIVVGGGIAGMAAALAAAREGAPTLLLQDRPVWGGNFSSEVRITADGGLDCEAFPGLGRIVKEITACRLRDEQLAALLLREPNLTALAGWRVTDAEAADGRIVAVVAQDVRDGRRVRYAGTLFADCTGDGELGFLAGADYRMGRENRNETCEPMAPERADRQVMGATLLWSSRETDRDQPFPDCPWAVQVGNAFGQKATGGAWNWETGFYRDQARDAETIRDYALRVIYGNWAWQKNSSPHAAEFRRRKLEWVGHVAGKRESRRLLGDVILTERDIREKRPYPDACVLSTWGVDVHVPEPRHEAAFPGEPWLAEALWQNPRNDVYLIPYRCLYSRNVANLFMAGRNISVTHVALGQVRVQHTTGLMGEVVGLAAALACQRQATPRALYTDHWPALGDRLRRGTAAPGNALMIDADFPGGNIVPVAINGDTVTLRPDTRGGGDWFHWYFRVRDAAGRSMTFVFDTRKGFMTGVVGVLGPAVSADDGQTWRWLGAEHGPGNAFVYTFGAEERAVRFAVAIPYTRANLDAFLAEQAGADRIARAVLCQSSKGRPVGWLRIGPPVEEAEAVVLLTARHHACEAMASYALEGVFAAALADDEVGRLLRARVALVVVPIVDVDGVEEGDPGKTRAPHDHGQDYAEPAPRYPETAAIQNLVRSWPRGRLRVALDLHCPLLSGWTNNELYFVGPPADAQWPRVAAFAAAFDRLRRGPLPHDPKYDLPFGRDWNVGPHGARAAAAWFAGQIEDGFAVTLEVPYAVAGGKPVTPPSARALGRDLAAALAEFLSLEAGESGTTR